MFLYGLLGTTYIIFYYLCVVYNNLIVKYQLCLNKLFSVSVSVSVLQQPYKEDQEETIADFLLFRSHNEETIIRNRDKVYELWKHINNFKSQQ